MSELHANAYMYLCVRSQREAAQRRIFLISSFYGNALLRWNAEGELLRQRRNAGYGFQFCLELADGP